MIKKIWNYILGLIILFGFYYLSKFIVDNLNIEFPATILGLILLYFALIFKIIKLEFVEKIANFFIKNMSVLFAPFIVGLIADKKLLFENLLPIVVIVFVSTAITMILCGLFVEIGLKHFSSKNKESENA